MNPAPNDAVPADCLIVQVQFYNVAQRSAKRMSKSVVLEKSSAGHMADVAKLERAAHQLAVVLALEVEAEGWKVRKDPKAEDPTSGEGSPL